MDNPFLMKRELRYGYPACDQILANRYFTIGYSWYFRQAKWSLELVRQDFALIPKDAGKNVDEPGGTKDVKADGREVERMNNFRADTRVPRRFRASLDAYKASGYDRGHLVASANKDQVEIQNSETFLLSNMSPQQPDLNRGLWRELEESVRQLDAREDVLETYVLTCPVFYFEKPVAVIGKDGDDYGISVPVPHAFIKSVLIEDIKGLHRMWTFEIPNIKPVDQDLASYLVKTYDAEQLVGGRFWDEISGSDTYAAKGGGGKIEAMWPADPGKKFPGLKRFTPKSAAPPPKPR